MDLVNHLLPCASRVIRKTLSTALFATTSTTMFTSTDDETLVDTRLLFTDVQAEEELDYISYGEKIKLWVAPKVRNFAYHRTNSMY
jgi:hypothetical protein